jgi:hypothetical protein
MAHFFETGPGRELFGASQDRAVEACRRLERELFALAVSIGNRDAATRVRDEIEQWARENPLEEPTFVRRSIAKAGAAETAAGLGTTGLASVGSIDETVRDISDRLTLYVEKLPDLLRWHAELMAVQMQTDFGEDVVADVASMERSIAELNAFVQGSPGLIGAEREAVLSALEKELAVAIGALDQQRTATLETLGGERELVLSRLDDELERAIGVLQEERATVLAALDEASSDAVERSRLAARDVVDHAFWRAVQLLLLGAALYLGIRLLLQRATATASSPPGADRGR